MGVHWCLCVYVCWCVCLAAFELIKHKKEISKLIKKVQTSKVAATVNEDCMPHAPRHMPHFNTHVSVFLCVCGDVTRAAGELIRSLLIEFNCS